MNDRRRFWPAWGVGALALALAVAIAAGWAPTAAAAPEEDAAQPAKVRYATRSNRLLLGAPLDLANCLDNRQRVIARPRPEVRAIVPELHVGHRFSLRLASWARINGGVHDDPGLESKRLLRVQMTFRVIGPDSDVPLLFDEDRRRYLPACAADQPIVDRPNDYPTIVIALGDQATPADGDRAAADAALRNRLVQHLSQRGRLLFLGNAPDLPDGGMAPPAAGSEQRLRDWVKAVFSAGRTAFLGGWPGTVTLSLDDPSSIGELSELRLEHRGAPDRPAAAVPAAIADGQAVTVSGGAPLPDTAVPDQPPTTGTVTTARSTPFVMLVPEIFAGHDLTVNSRLREVGGRCSSDWRRVADDPRAYEVDCRLPPPYEVAIGRLAAVRSEQAHRIVRIDELVVNTVVPLTDDWPKSVHANGKGRIGPLPLREFLHAGARLPMFDALSEDSAPARRCVATLDGDLSIVLDGLAVPMPAPCAVRPLALPAAWTQRIKGSVYPVIDGCMGATKNAECLQPQDGDLPVRLDFGPGWAPVEMPAAQVNPDTVAAMLKPVWPYAANPTSPPAGGDATDRLELLGVSYCYDVGGEHCCTGGPRRFEFQPLQDRLPQLPNLAEVGCRTDRPLPHFAVAEFQRVDPGSLLHRFRRYWTISATAGRPYTVPRQETIRTFPIRLDADRLPQRRDGWRIALFSNLLSCQTADAGTGSLDTLPFNAEAVRSRQVSIPVFALVTGPDGPVSQCAEGTLSPDAAGSVVFSLLPQAREAAGR